MRQPVTAAPKEPLEFLVSSLQRALHRFRYNIDERLQKAFSRDCSAGILTSEFSRGAEVTGAELIIAALVAGGTAGATNMSSTAVMDIYTTLRETLRRRLSGNPESQATLDASHSDKDYRQPDVQRILIESDSVNDSEILHLAHRLLALTSSRENQPTQLLADNRQSKGIQVGNFNTQTNNFS